MKRYHALFTVLILGIYSCQIQSKRESVVDIHFPLSDTLSLFAEGVVSTRHNVRDFTLSPDYEELFYSVQHSQTGFTLILHSKKINDKWAIPEVAPFSGQYADFEPSFSPDGLRLYFSSNRPKEVGTEQQNFDIWYVEKSGDQWGDPVNVGSPVNTDKNEFYPSVARNGNLYYTASYSQNVRREDIYVSRFVEGTYTEPEALDTAINSASFQFNAFVSPEEDFLIFSSWGREDDMGRGDLYISFKDSSDQWMPAKNVGETINSKFLDYCPFVSADKQYFFFSSDRMDTEMFKNKNLNWREFEDLVNSPLNGSTNIYILKFAELLQLK